MSKEWTITPLFLLSYVELYIVYSYSSLSKTLLDEISYIQCEYGRTPTDYHEHDEIEGRNQHSYIDYQWSMWQQSLIKYDFCLSYWAPITNPFLLQTERTKIAVGNRGYYYSCILISICYTFSMNRALKQRNEKKKRLRLSRKCCVHKTSS